MKRWLFLLFLAIWPVSGQTVPGRYIVVLDGEPAAATIRSVSGQRMAAPDRLAAIRLQQRAVEARLAARGVIVQERLETLANALIVESGAEPAASLISIAGVRRVEPVRQVHLHLDAALPVLGVPEAWTASGGQDRAGLGIKIGILDTGIDTGHPGLQDPALPLPPGYPIVNEDADRVYTTNKVIVMRNYDRLAFAISRSGRDVQGHGTAVAMVAAGNLVTSPRGPISGVAPKAYLGSYKVFSGMNSSTGIDIILKAFEDAVRDGMDVINMSLGSNVAPRPNDSVLAEMIERATELGVLVVVSAGNNGPVRLSLGDAAVAPSAITIGALQHTRIYAASVVAGALAPMVALPGTGPTPAKPIAGPFVDAASLDPSGLVCSSLPAGSLTGRIPLILRGTCNFSVKLDNAKAAGAIAAVVYTDADRPDPITMSVDTATLPAEMVSYADGLRLKALLAGNATPTVTLNFTSEPVGSDWRRLASFSSRGPSTDFSIKPDLAAIGSSVYTAAPTSQGSYQSLSGTSFAAPMAAGAAAVLMAARPGLAARQYRSLLIDAAAPVLRQDGSVIPIQEGGTGALNLANAVRATAAAYPVSLSFGVASGTVDQIRPLLLQNLSPAPQVYSVDVVPLSAGPAPAALETSVALAAGEVRTILIRFSASALEGGEYSGYLRIAGGPSGVPLHVPYWLGVPKNTPAAIAVVDSQESGRPGASLNSAILVRVLDASGIPVAGLAPEVSVVSGGGSVNGIASADTESPGLFRISVRLGNSAGNNTFRVSAGGSTRDVTIVGSSSTLTREPVAPRLAP